jgi:hypothetical protein
MRLIVSMWSQIMWGEEGVVVVEAADQGLGQGRDLLPQPAHCQLGEHLRVALTGDQRVQHGSAGLAEDIGGHHG